MLLLKYSNNNNDNDNNNDNNNDNDNYNNNGNDGGDTERVPEARGSMRKATLAKTFQAITRCHQEMIALRSYDMRPDFMYISIFS